MKCPHCSGEYDRIDLLTASGETVDARKCTQCSGIWFPRPLVKLLNLQSVTSHDKPSPNYSMKSTDLVCSLDGTLMSEGDHDYSPHSGQYWACPDCDGMFFPKGQLALYQDWLESHQKVAAINHAGFSRVKAIVVVISIFVLTTAILAAISRTGINLQASQAQTLPNSGPNVLTLVMLALTYISGTVLAVLGRRLPIIFMGWAVIVTCLFGFSIIIFGP